MLLALHSLLCLQAQVARLHGRHGPQDSWSLTGAVLGLGFLHARCCAMCGVLVQTVQYWRFRSCSSSRWSLPVVSQRQIPMVLAVQMTIFTPQLQLIDKVADVLFVHFVQVPQVQVVILTSFFCSWYRSWRRQPSSHICRCSSWSLVTCLLLFRQGMGSRRSETADFSAVSVLLRGLMVDDPC